MRSFESNLAFVRACLTELPDYERAEALFWTISARPPPDSPPFLQMTFANVWLALDEMRAVEGGLSPAARLELTRVRSEWETRWAGRSALAGRKATRELASRIGQWRAYVHDVLETGDLADYVSAVRPRLCAARLLEELGAHSDRASGASAELEGLDARLDARTEEGPCVLGAEMAAIYPPAPGYGFLYRRPGPLSG